MIVSRSWSFAACWRDAWIYLAISALLFSFFLVACSGPSFGGNSNAHPNSTSAAPSPSASQVALAQLHWCGKPLMLFRDEGAPPTATPTTVNTPTGTATSIAPRTATASVTATPPVTGTPKTLTDWSQVEPNLGFSVYLPATLPQNSCLVSALGTIHDPIIGGSFTIGYLLPDHGSVSLSEAPLRSQSTQFQCNVSTDAAVPGVSSQEAKTPVSTHSTPTPTPTPTPEQICSGAMGTTNIIFSARGSTQSLQQFFNALQPNINWIPAS